MTRSSLQSYKIRGQKRCPKYCKTYTLSAIAYWSVFKSVCVCVDRTVVFVARQMSHFRRELSDLKTRSSAFDFNIGGGDEMTKLRQDSDNMAAFCSEVKTTTQVRVILLYCARFY